MFVLGASQALRDQFLVLADRIGHAAVGGDVGNIELPALLENPVDRFEDKILARREVDDAVGNDEVYALVRNGLSYFDEVLVEGRIRATIAKPAGHLGSVLAGDRELFVGHVDAVDENRPVLPCGP